MNKRNIAITIATIIQRVLDFFFFGGSKISISFDFVAIYKRSLKSGNYGKLLGSAGWSHNDQKNTITAITIIAKITHKGKGKYQNEPKDYHNPFHVNKDNFSRIIHQSKNGNDVGKPPKIKCFSYTCKE